VTIDLVVDVRPPWPYRLPLRGSGDGVLRRHGPGIRRLLDIEGTTVVAGATQPARDCVRFVARGEDRAACEEAIARMRFATCVDDDLREFHERFRHDPLIGRAVRSYPTVRVGRRAEPFEALAWAITEQLIELERAFQIQRRILRGMAARCPQTGLLHFPTARDFAGAAPAWLQSCDLSAGRALALVKAAREVATGRVDLRSPDHERAWERLRRIPGIGSWTLEMLALHGQGRYDQLPAGDVNWIKLVGRLKNADPRSRAADEHEVREFFAPYEPWTALAAPYMAISARRGWVRGPVAAPARLAA
jgi:3-methyladenine DNA glycosylase/8-oxoguanine DNA glycosylase